MHLKGRLLHLPPQHRTLPHCHDNYHPRAPDRPQLLCVSVKISPPCLQDCIALAERLRESGGAQSTGRLRGALRALSAERLPAASAAAGLARAAAPPAQGRPLTDALAQLRWGVLVRCSSGLRSLAFLPWEVRRSLLLLQNPPWQLPCFLASHDDPMRLWLCSLG